MGGAKEVKQEQSRAKAGSENPVMRHRTFAHFRPMGTMSALAVPQSRVNAANEWADTAKTTDTLE
jgi:hypothetical protein